MKRRIDIIGAGISGLATAYYLSAALQRENRDPVDIHVWEKDPTPGGLAGSFEIPGGGIIEKFYHHFYRRDAALQVLLDEVGLGEELIWQPAATGAYYARQPYRLSSPFDLLRFKPLPLLDRFRMGWMVLYAKWVKDWQSLDNMSAKDYILRVAGENVYRVVWEPLLYGKFGEYAESISAAWLQTKLTDRGTSRNRRGHELLGYLRGGLGRLFETLVSRLQDAGHSIHLGNAVRKLQGAGNRIETLITDKETVPVDIVVGCTQTPDLIAMLPEHAEAYRSELRQIRYLANVCLVLTLNRSLSDFYWTNIPDTDAPFVGIIEQTKWVDRSEYNQKHLVYLSSYVTQNDPRLSMSAEALVDSYLPAIRKLFPKFGMEYIEAMAVWKAAYAQPIVQMGYRHHVPEILSPIENLFLCTMAQIYPHDRQVSNGIAMAKKTAMRVLQRLNS